MSDTNSTNWKILNKKDIKSADQLLDILLKNRGLTSKKQKEEFLNPTHPKKITLKELKISTPEVKKAIQRIKKAKENNEKIIVYGDYDADGITATAILWEALFALKLNTLPFIPNRFQDGYGISPKSIKKIIKKHPDTKLIITVDNGIAALKGAKEAKKLGIDLIITDHHTKKKSKPPAVSTIHTTSTSGSAIAWFFSREIVKNFQTSYSPSLELAAIGTIADQLPLININRSIAKYGIQKLNKTNRLGLLTLLNEANSRPKDVETYHINFVLAPRLNAAGRLEDAMDALRLLCTNSPLKAKSLSTKLNKINSDRQKIVDETINAALGSITHKKSPRIILVHGEDYHEGIIGLVASKITEKHYLPSIVISTKEKVAKASARSISGVNLAEIINNLEHLIIEGGGHEMAAGFSISKKDIPKLEKKLKKLGKIYLKKELLKKEIKIDTELSFKLINFSLLNTLQKLNPTGNANPTPTFVTKGVKPKFPKTVGKQNSHLKFTATKNSHELNAIAFNMGHLINQIKEGKPIDIVYKLKVDEWNGRKKINLFIKDFKNV